ncbi:phospholipase D family protein [Maridesulfovibrio sp.]|uniref:phospholipase D family protein n=1 Tax=Maridesulfovibrio sp. TaxID=2795000 RepID=UPI002A188F3A|nr:phospholipase D family protein [Maridesulfovibrio sp.]
MKLLKTGEIRGAVERCEPERIAVAYVGLDWEKFIDKEKVKEVVVSPTEGSNPKGIQSLVDCLSWDNVHFLDNLHCKFYIGEQTAILGSPNLSRNGIAEAGLEEAAVEITDLREIENLSSYFSEIKQSAMKKYPAEEMKKQALSDLYNIWRERERSNGAEEIEEDGEELLDYAVLSETDFYIAWYGVCDNVEYRGDIENYESLIDDEMHLAAGDKIRKGKWVLCWKVTSKNRPDMQVKPHWLFIDELFENAVYIENEEYDYTTVAVMRSDKEPVKPPFELTPNVIRAFKELIGSEKYLSTFVGGEGVFYIKDTFPVFKQFMADWKKMIS